MGFSSSGKVTRKIFTQVLAVSSFRLTHAIYMCVKKKSLQERSLKFRIYTRFSCLNVYCCTEYADHRTEMLSLENCTRLLAIDLFCCFTLINNKNMNRGLTLKLRQAGKNASLCPVIIQKHPCRPRIKLTEQV